MASVDRWGSFSSLKRTFFNNTKQQIFNITNDEPVFMWDFMKMLFEAVDARPSFVIRIPFSVAFPLAYIAEGIAWILKPVKKLHLTFSVFRMRFLSSNRYFSIQKAKTVLGYAPIVSLEEGVQRSAKWLKSLKRA